MCSCLLKHTWGIALMSPRNSESQSKFGRQLVRLEFDLQKFAFKTHSHHNNLPFERLCRYILLVSLVSYFGFCNYFYVERSIGVDRIQSKKRTVKCPKCESMMMNNICLKTMKTDKTTPRKTKRARAMRKYIGWLIEYVYEL